MSEATVLLAALYLAAFVIGGGQLLTLAFGKSYAGFGDVVAWLAVMWSLRMLQAVPGMALMAAGETKPFLVAGIIRASVLPLVLYAALNGAALATLATFGCAGELCSLLYVSLRLESVERGLGRILLLRALFLIPAAIVGLTFALAAFTGPGRIFLAMIGALAMLAATGAAVMPALRAQIRYFLAHAEALPAK